MYHNFTPFPILRSKRLILKQLELEHAESIYRYQANKEHFPYVDMEVYTEISQAESYITKMNAGVESKAWIIWAICLKETEKIIGTVSIWNLNFEKEQAEFGYGLFPDYRHHGYMQEALGLAMDYGFSVMKLKTLEAYTSHDNLPSKRLLNKMNFNFIKTFKDDYSNGTLMDLFIIQQGEENGR